MINKENIQEVGEKIYFICLSCNAGDHNRIIKGGKLAKQRNSFVLKEGEIAPKEVGDWITFKNCPDCGNKTLVKD